MALVTVGMAGGILGSVGSLRSLPRWGSPGFSSVLAPWDARWNPNIFPGKNSLGADALHLVPGGRERFFIPLPEASIPSSCTHCVSLSRASENKQCHYPSAEGCAPYPCHLRPQTNGLFVP